MSQVAVLVVRETPSLADSVEELLLSEGYHIRRAVDGHEAMKIVSRAHRIPIQAILVVCNEPVCSNMDSIATLGLTIPVLVLGWRGPAFEDEAHEQITFLRLPITAGRLLEEVRLATHRSPLAVASTHVGRPPRALGRPMARIV